MREIQLNELRPALDQFSKTHQGWMAALQDSDEVVKQTEARDLPLLGISADSHDGENDIVIMLGDRPERHVTHVIHRPAHVRIEDHLEGKEETIDIERRGGGTSRCAAIRARAQPAWTRSPAPACTRCPDQKGRARMRRYKGRCPGDKASAARRDISITAIRN